MSGDRCAKVPTAPDNLPTLTAVRARRTRAMSRSISEDHKASFKPKVIGSA